MQIEPFVMSWHGAGGPPGHSAGGIHLSAARAVHQRGDPGRRGGVPGIQHRRGEGRRPGLAGGCPAEQDNAGCFFRDGSFQAAEHVTANKEFCDCAFAWQLPGGASGVSIGRTLPALPTEVKTVYPRQACTVEHAAVIPCDQVLGTYKVTFDRVSSLK